MVPQRGACARGVRAGDARARPPAAL